MRREWTLLTAAVLAGVVGLSACGTNRVEGSGAGNGCDTSKGVLIVGLIAPLSGGLSAVGLGMRDAADLAVKQANEQCRVPGYQLRLEPEDDRATPQDAVQVASRLAADDNVVGVVGTYNSSTAQAVQPVLHEKGIVLVSPGNTGPSLTRGDDAVDAPRRPLDNYFRTTTTDLVQGPYGAQYLVQKVGAKRIALIDDGKTHGVGIADQFVAEAKKLGANVVARERVGEHDADFSAVITTIRAKNPDAVYFGGEYPTAGPLAAQLSDAGLDIPLMGGDGISDPQFVALGGRPGDLATGVGAPADTLPSAARFIADYKAAGYPEDYGPYGPFAYDSSNVIIDGLATALGGGDYTDRSRAAIVAAVRATRIDEASGPISFDEFGDTTNKVLTIYRVEGEGFKPVQGSTSQFQD
jgi:branched-chain amino acid transport system substrate-binding protein